MTMYTLATLSILAGVSAIALPRSTCSFGLTALGGQSGTVGSLPDGQLRLGGGLPPATLTIDHGGVSNAAGWGCILTPSVNQYQCDEGSAPALGFAIGFNGTFTSSGSSVFFACPASSTEYNIYTTPVTGQSECVQISLTANGCGVSSNNSTSTSSMLVGTSITTTLPESSTQTTTYSTPASSSVGTSVMTTLPETSIETITTTETLVISSTAEVVKTTTIYECLASSTTTFPIVTSTTIEISSGIFQSFTGTLSSESTTTTLVSPPTLTTSPSLSTVAPSSSIDIPTTSIQVTSVIKTLPPTTTPYLTTPTYSNTTLLSSTRTWLSTAPYQNTTMTTSTTSTAVSSSASCIATALTGSDTSGNYQYPHLIVPVSSTSPDTAYGTQYFGNVASNVSTIFNFDIPESYAGDTCNLIFLLPEQDQLETSSYTLSGSGEIEFEQLSSAANAGTTYNNAPSVQIVLGTFDITEGSSTLIQSTSCSAGQTLSYKLTSVGDTSLYYFQDWNPSPIGLFITYC